MIIAPSKRDLLAYDAVWLVLVYSCACFQKKTDKHAVHNSYASFILIPPKYRTDTSKQPKEVAYLIPTVLVTVTISIIMAFLPNYCLFLPCILLIDKICIWRNGGDALDHIFIDSPITQIMRIWIDTSHTCMAN